MSRSRVYIVSPKDQVKHKDGWTEDRPTILADPVDGRPVGKCPFLMPLSEAQQLLDEGIFPDPPNPRRVSPYPRDIFNIYQGVPYRAHQTGPGRYHGFPERPSKIPPAILVELIARATESNELDAFEQWRDEVDTNESDANEADADDT